MMEREELRQEILGALDEIMCHPIAVGARMELVKAQRRFWSVRHEQELDELLLDEVLNKQDERQVTSSIS